MSIDMDMLKVDNFIEYNCPEKAVINTSSNFEEGVKLSLQARFKLFAN
jgi:hypothetical protein